MAAWPRITAAPAEVTAGVESSHMQAHGKFPLRLEIEGGHAHVSVGSLEVGMMGISLTTFVDMQ